MKKAIYLFSVSFTWSYAFLVQYWPHIAQISAACPFQSICLFVYLVVPSPRFINARFDKGQWGGIPVPFLAVDAILAVILCRYKQASCHLIWA